MSSKQVKMRLSGECGLHIPIWPPHKAFTCSCWVWRYRWSSEGPPPGPWRKHPPTTGQFARQTRGLKIFIQYLITARPPLATRHWRLALLPSSQGLFLTVWEDTCAAVLCSRSFCRALSVLLLFFLAKSWRKRCCPPMASSTSPDGSTYMVCRPH